MSRSSFDRLPFQFGNAGAATASASADRGFRPLYHRDSVNHCPGCGQAQWHIGRMSAECAFCGTALLLQEITTREARPVYGLDRCSSASRRFRPLF